jgi:arginyl-tRNA--protein-N-Asp/Glu arginylyltransferase
MGTYLKGTKSKPSDKEEKVVESPYKLLQDDVSSCVAEYLEENGFKDVKYKVNVSNKAINGAGDLHSNICIQISKVIKLEPKEVVKSISDIFQNKYLKQNSNINKVTVSDLGHLNFHLIKKVKIFPQKSIPKEHGQTHELEFKLVPSGFIQEEYEIFQKYQAKVHNDTGSSPESYKSNFCDNPIIYDQNSEIGYPYGSYHLQYILDGKIIAVSIVDLLPTGLNCMYHFYDTVYGFLSMGTYSAIHEIQWVQELNLYSSKFEYYYLGSYVHHCSKVNYKKQYQPAQLLDPVTNTFVPYNVCSKMLDKTKFCQFNLDSEPEDRMVKMEDINKILVCYDRKFFRFGSFEKEVTKDGMERLTKFVQAFGKKLSTRVLYYLDPKDVVGYVDPIIDKMEEPTTEMKEIEGSTVTATDSNTTIPSQSTQ